MGTWTVFGALFIVSFERDVFGTRDRQFLSPVVYVGTQPREEVMCV